MVLSGNGITLFVKFAVLFLLGCILLLFAAAAVLNRSSITDDDDALYLVHPSTYQTHSTQALST